MLGVSHTWQEYNHRCLSGYKGATVVCTSFFSTTGTSNGQNKKGHKVLHLPGSVTVMDAKVVMSALWSVCASLASTISRPHTRGDELTVTSRETTCLRSCRGHGKGSRI
eukprot:1156388-Pelagomonas_calceolata.AAC.4